MLTLYEPAPSGNKYDRKALTISGFSGQSADFRIGNFFVITIRFTIQALPLLLFEEPVVQNQNCLEANIHIYRLSIQLQKLPVHLHIQLEPVHTNIASISIEK